MRSPSEADPWDEDDDIAESVVVASESKRPDRIIHQVWQPDRVKPPQIHRELSRLTWPERCAETLRFFILHVEHWLSSGGALREWIRLNLRIAICLIAAAVLVVPPVSFILESTAEWASLVATTAQNLSGTILGLPPVIVALSSIYLLARFVHRRVFQKRRFGRDQHDPYSMQ